MMSEEQQKEDIKDCDGYKKLLEDVKRDCAEGEGCFNPDGCDKQAYRSEKGHCYMNTKCFHQYCDKFRWIMDRVKHYSEQLGIPESDILDSWEKDRDYWYMNYYQDSRQPLITSVGNVRIFNTREEFQTSLQEKGFRCPRCNHVSMKHNECDSDECDWKAYGLLGTLGKGVTVIIKETLEMTEIFMPVAWAEKGVMDEMQSWRDEQANELENVDFPTGRGGGKE